MIRWNLNPQFSDVVQQEAVVDLWLVNDDEGKVTDISSIHINFMDGKLLKLVKHQDGHYVVDIDTDEEVKEMISDE